MRFTRIFLHPSTSLGFVRSALLVSLFFVLTLLAIPQSQAQNQNWQSFELRSVTFSMPSDWSLINRIRDEQYDFKSPDGRVEIWWRWWFPDEPLLGYLDIVHHKKQVIAGQEALIIHSEIRSNRSITIAFLKKDSEGEQFLITMNGDNLSWQDLQQIQAMVLSQLSYEGVRAGPQNQSNLRPPQPAGNSQPLGNQYGQNTSIPSGGNPMGTPSVAGTSDAGQASTAQGPFSVALAANWQQRRSRIQGLDSLVALSPDGQSMIIAAAAEAGTGSSSLDQIDEFVGLLYREHIIVKSIEGEDYPTIAGTTAQAVAYEAKVYEFGGLSVPYKRAKAWIYRGGDNDKAFAIATISPLNGGADQQLADIARTFSYSGGSVPPTPIAMPTSQPMGQQFAQPQLQSPSQPQQQGGGQGAPMPQTITIDDGNDYAQNSGTQVPWQDVLAQKIGPDCRRLDLATWKHPTRKVMEKRDVKIEWVALCKQDQYPVFGVKFPYDPRGQTRDYFSPLYIKMMKANGNWPFSFLSEQDRLLISVVKDGPKSITLDYFELPEQSSNQSNQALSSDLAQAEEEPQINYPSAATQTVAGGAPTPQAQDEQMEEEPEKPVLGTAVLFRGQITADWQPIEYEGASFANWARENVDGLHIGIPPQKGWAKAGIASRQMLLERPRADEAYKSQISYSFEAGRMQSAILALLPAGKGQEEPWNNHDFWIGVHTDEEGKGKLFVFERRQKLFEQPFEMPNGDLKLVVTLRPDEIMHIADEEGRIQFEFPLHKDIEAFGWYASIFCQPTNQNLKADLRLKTVDIARLAYEANDEVDTYSREARTYQIFGGTTLGRQWQGLSSPAKAFGSYARFKDGALHLDVPSKARTSHVGLLSSEPAIWLDDLAQGGEIELDIRFGDSGQSGYGIAFANALLLNDHGIGNDMFVLRAEELEDGSFQVRVRDSYQFWKDPAVYKAEGLKAPPSHIKLAFTSQGITMKTPGLPSRTWPAKALVRDGTGLRLKVFGIARASDGPIKLAIKSMRLTNKEVQPDAKSVAMPGVQDIDLIPLFDRQLNDKWEKIENSAVAFAKFARQTPDGLHMAKLPEDGHSTRIGLLSRDPIVKLDKRLLRTDHKVELVFDQKDLTGVRVFLSPYKKHEMAGDAPLQVFLEEIRQGPQAGQFRFILRHSYYGYWRRVVERGWIENEWDGRLTILISNGKSSAQLGKDVTLTGPNEGIHARGALFMSVTAGQEQAYEHGSFTLQSVRAGWAMPQLMTQSERWTLLDDEEFDAQQYLKALAQDIEGVVQ